MRYDELAGIYGTFLVSIQSVREGNLLRKGKALYRDSTLGGTERNTETMHSVWEEWGCSKDLGEGRSCTHLGVVSKVTNVLDGFTWT